MKENTKHKNLALSLVIILLGLVCIFAGCAKGGDNQSTNLATNKQITSIPYENETNCYYVEVKVYTDKDIVISSEDFTYIQDGTTKTAIGFIKQTRVKSTTVNGVTERKSYVSETGTTFNCETKYITTVQLIIENDSTIDSISFKGNKIAKTELFKQ